MTGARAAADAPQHSASLAVLAVAAIGIVFGDIATSPLYALQEAFGAHGVRPTPENVLGVLSLTFWSLIGVVSLKYVLFIMRAHNKGEGDIMALLALARPPVRLPRPQRHAGHCILPHPGQPPDRDWAAGGDLRAEGLGLRA